MNKERTEYIRVEAESVPEAGASQDFDIMEMPPEGVAAYWLSIKKLSDMRRSKKLLAEEARYTDEPFVRHLLEIGLDQMDEALVERMAAARKKVLLGGYRRKLDCMRLACRAMAGGENPRLALVRMTAFFPRPPIGESKAVEFSAALARAMGDKDVERAKLAEVSHRLSADRLLVKLHFYGTLVRRRGAAGLKPFLPHLRSHFFAEGAKLVMDSFDASFVDRHLGVLSRELLADTAGKMEMSLAMFQGLRAKLDYDQLYLLARAHLPVD